MVLIWLVVNQFLEIEIRFMFSSEINIDDEIELPDAGTVGFMSNIKR